MDTLRPRRRVPQGRALIAVVVVAAAVVAGSGVAAFAGLAPCPTQASANDRAAQSNLTNAMTALADLAVQDGSTFRDVASHLARAAPEFHWADGPVSPVVANAISFNPCADGPRCRSVAVAAWGWDNDTVCSWWGRWREVPLGKGPDGRGCWLAVMTEVPRAPASDPQMAPVTMRYAFDPVAATCSAGTAGRPPPAPYGWYDTWSEVGTRLPSG